MRMPFARRVLVAVVAVAVVASAVVVPPASAQDAPPDPGTDVTFLVGLPHDSAGLQAAAVRASSPGSRGFRKYLTLREAASRFGASPAHRTRLREAAAKAGLEARVDPTGLFARVTGTVAEWEAIVGRPVHYEPAAPGSAQWSDAPPFAHYRFPGADKPAALAKAITWWMPTYMVYVPSLDIPGVPPREPNPRVLLFPEDEPPTGPVNMGSPLGTTCQPADWNERAFTPDQVSTAYGMRGLQDLVSEGLEPIVTLLSLGGGFAQSDLSQAAACFGHTAPRVDVRLGVGVPQPVVSLSAESALDLQTVAWALHGARQVRVVQVVNSDTAWLEGFALALSDWRTLPHAISLSWGECELAVDPFAGPGQTTESLFRLAAVVGVSVFTAAGDTGSSVCQTAGAMDASYPNVTVGYPASSPWMTAVGGTQLNLGAGNARLGEAVWNDLQYGLEGNAVGTGGPSSVFAAPWYQRPRTWSDVRTVPDLAAQAGMFPGMTLFLGGQPFRVAGTSQASPLVASGFAMLSAELADSGEQPLGFINPWLYRIVRRHPGVVYDVTVGANQYPMEYAPQSVNIPACCQATPGYDMASGLGAPLFARLSRYVAG